jgi:hypothetical protein
MNTHAKCTQLKMMHTETQKLSQYVVYYSLRGREVKILLLLLERGQISLLETSKLFSFASCNDEMHIK